jgi:hypothetical protein
MEMRKTSIAQGHKDKRGFTGTDELKMRMQAIGAVCEGAICRLFGWPFKTMQAQSFKVADLPGNIQVRLISHEHYGLRVYPDDDPAWRVVGVVIPQGRERKPYRLPGWISAIEAKDRADWAIAPNGRPPVVAVPQQHLRPLTELRELLRAEGHL